MIKFPRIRNRLFTLAGGATALYMGYLAISTIGKMRMDLMMVLFLAFFAVWICLVAWAVVLGFLALQSVRIHGDIIRLCIGPLTLKRIDLSRVKTVGEGRMKLNLRAVWHPETAQRVTVLSYRTVDELNELGALCLNNPNVRVQLERSGVSPTGSSAAARAYLLKKTASEPLWIQSSPKVEEALRERLPDAIFLL